MMLTTLARASLDCSLLAAAVWGVNRMIPNLPSAARALLWWCVAAKFILTLVWTTPVLLPLLPAAETDTLQRSVPGEMTARIPVAPRTDDARSSAISRLPRPDWSAMLLVAWITGSGLMILRAVSRWWMIRRAVDLASPADDEIQQVVRDLAAQMRLKTVPEVRRSQEVSTPLVTGASRPVVLVPSAAFERLTDRQRRLVLAHELTHVKRADLLFGCIPALAERLFFFHPIAHLAAREYAFWREAACDATVVDMLEAAPQEYGALLLDLGVARRAGSFAAAGAPWSFSVLKRRIVMLQDQSRRSIAGRLTAGVAVVLAIASIAPLRLSARTAAGPSRITLSDISPAAAPTTAAAAAAVVQERAPRPHEELNYVYFISDEHTTMSGSSKDMQRAKTFKRRGEPLLWFKTGGREYIVRDRAILDQIEQVWESVREIGAEQGQVGAKQGAIGEGQGKIGQQQGVIGAQQGMVGARQSEIGAQQGALGAREWRKLTDAEKNELDRKRRELDDRMKELDVEMRKLDDRMRELDRPMSELNDRMKELDKEMSALDARMKVAVEKAEDAMRQLLDRAISSGAAQNVR